jgi:hypothetical protein
VIRLEQHFAAAETLFEAYGVELVTVDPGAAIPGSYWGDSEAGLIGAKLYARADTPLHSVLHEGAHYICMDEQRRASLDRDAGGDYDEENAVCYLQILLADLFDGVGRQRMCADMDAWGYTFRLGSAQAWFERDAEDARAWLTNEGLIDALGALVAPASRRGRRSRAIDRGTGPLPSQGRRDQ